MIAGDLTLVRQSAQVPGFELVVIFCLGGLALSFMAMALGVDLSALTLALG
jgi:hypothetical protein